jgi:hypothetical protein
MAIPILQGRPFTPSDRHDAVAVGIVNESFARREWPGENPIGKEIRIYSPRGPQFTVVGVVGDVRQHGLGSTSRPEMYRPLEQFALSRNFVVLRAVPEVDPESLAPGVREAVWSIDPGVPIFRMSSMSAVVADSVASRRLLTSLLAGLAGLALLLAGIGVYGVTSYVVAERSPEIGLRIALGARSGRVLVSALRQGMFPAVVGIGLGLLGAAASDRFLSSLLYQAERSPRLLIFVSVAVVLALTALAACYVPARRASRLDPMAVLRLEGR